MLTNDQMIQQLLVESNSLTVAAAARAIRESFGNLPFPSDAVEIFISAESERLGALLRHDMEMFLLRLKHAPDSVPTVWPTQPTNDRDDEACIAIVARKGHGQICGLLRREHYSVGHNFQGGRSVDVRRNNAYLKALENWIGEPRRENESLDQFQRRVMQEVERG